MNLIQVTKGIYSLDGFEIEYAEEFAVVVHPFCIFPEDGIYYYPNSYRKSYRQNLYKFLDTFTGPVLTLEEGRSMKKTLKKYKKSNHVFNRFFVVTKENDPPEPKEIGWEDVTEFIKEFKPKKLKALGGYYDTFEEFDDCSGCLTTTIKRLSRDFKDIELIEGCIF